MSPRILSIDDGMHVAVDLLRSGGVVAIPTETVYGLAANALDPRAVARIFEIKRRPTFDPLIVHVATPQQLRDVVTNVPAIARSLIDAFWPGPMTLVLPKSEIIPSVVTAGLDTVAVRMPAHDKVRRLISAAGMPLAAPSANTFGQLSPTRAQHVSADLGESVDLILDDGPTSHGVESTIVDLSGGVPTVLRHGAVTTEEIESVVGALKLDTFSSSPVAPGQLAGHYAPRARLLLVKVGEPRTVEGSSDVAYLAFQEHPQGVWGQVVVLSESGDLREAAARLFDALHQLDTSGVSTIYAETVPDRGLGRAINDRLTRAAATDH